MRYRIKWLILGIFVALKANAFEISVSTPPDGTGSGRPGTAVPGSPTTGGGTPANYYIHSLGQTDTCLSYRLQVANDHRTGAEPGAKIYTFIAEMTTCAQAPFPIIQITGLDGTPWNGSNGQVKIRFGALCLKNPLEPPIPGATDRGEIHLTNCTDIAPESNLQVWTVNKNANGAVQFSSDAEFLVGGYSSPKLECMERNGPKVVFRTACGVNNWQIHRLP